jgi:hypothetical protein
VETFSGSPDAETFVGDESDDDAEVTTFDLPEPELPEPELPEPELPEPGPRTRTPPRAKAPPRPPAASVDDAPAATTPAAERITMPVQELSSSLFDEVETLAKEPRASLGARSLVDDFSPVSERTRPPDMATATMDLSGVDQNSIELDLGTLDVSGKTQPRQARDSEMVTAIQPPAAAAQPGGRDNSIELDLGPLHVDTRKRLHTEHTPTTVRKPDQAAGRRPALPAIVDVIPYGLGMGTVAGFCEELIRRNSQVPTQTQRVFSTSKDQQQSVRILICQGESRRIEENVILGDLVLDGLTPRPRGATKIEVTFQIDPSGILRVRARDCETGLEQQASLNILGTPLSEEVEAAAGRLRRLRG